jgi:hypothetical protein
MKTRLKTSIYLLIYLAFAFGTTSFFSEDRVKLLIYFLLVTIIYFIRNKTINARLFYFVLFFLIIYGIQLFIFGEGKLQPLIFLVLTVLLLPYFLLHITGASFMRYYVNIVFFLAILSLIFWVASNLSPAFYKFTSTIPIKYNTDLIEGNDKMFIIYTYETGSVYNIIRNPGPTWEPGGWAVFIILAVVFNLFLKKTLWSFKNIVFIITTLTTFSTSGYLSLFILLFHFVIFSRTDIGIKVFISASFLALAIILFNDLEFMNQKINSVIESGQQTHIRSTESGRYLSFRKSLVTMSEYPLTGRGLLAVTGPTEGEAGGQGYGILSIATRFGIIALPVYLIYFFMSLKIINNICSVQNKYFAISAFIAIMINLVAQGVYSSPLFMMIFLIAPLKINLSSKWNNL